YPTCLDSLFKLKIEVQPNPTVTVDDDAKICYGDTMKLNGVIKPDWYTYDLVWSPGASLDNSKKADPIFTANSVGNTTLKLVAKSSANCSDSDDVTLEIFPAK